MEVDTTDLVKVQGLSKLMDDVNLDAFKVIYETTTNLCFHVI